MTVETYDMTEFKDEEDLKGFDVPAEGWYHVVVNDVDQTREKINAVRLEVQILAGTVKKQNGKTWWEAFFDPSPDSSDHGRFALKRIGTFALATGLITRAQLGQALSFDWEAVRGRQFVCKVCHRESESKGKKYTNANIDGVEMYPVNHADVAQIPKDAMALSLLGQAGVGQQLPPVESAPINPAPATTTAPLQPPPPTAAPTAVPPAAPATADGKQNWSNF